MVTPEEGRAAVGLAREAVARCVGPEAPRDPASIARDRPFPPLFDEPRGVFVTLKRSAGDELRGCIGYPLPAYPLRVAIPRVAAAAALEDPRFPAVRPAELAGITVEVSILTVPERIEADPRDLLPREVKVGRDGLIVDAEGASGLLLPQVAVEERWDPRTFLAETCRKAGLPGGAWRAPGTRVRRFSAEVFAETTPGGPVRPVPLG